MEITKLLSNENLSIGRILYFSKSEYRAENPTNVVYFNANIITIADGKVWYGDLDLTRDGEALKRVAIELGEPLFILKELDCRFLEENTPLSELITKAVWNTTEEIPIK